MSKDKEIEQLCENIRLLRKRDGLSKTRMAEIMGISPATLTKIEGGVLPRRVGVKVLIRLSDHFGIRLNCLFLSGLHSWPHEKSEEED